METQVERAREYLAECQSNKEGVSLEVVQTLLQCDRKDAVRFVQKNLTTKADRPHSRTWCQGTALDTMPVTIEMEMQLLALL